MHLSLSNYTRITNLYANWLKKTYIVHHEKSPSILHTFIRQNLTPWAWGTRFISFDLWLIYGIIKCEYTKQWTKKENTGNRIQPWKTFYRPAIFLGCELINNNFCFPIKCCLYILWSMNQAITIQLRHKMWTTCINPLANDIKHCVSLTSKHPIMERVNTNIYESSDPICRGHIPRPCLKIVCSLYLQKK